MGNGKPVETWLSLQARVGGPETLMKPMLECSQSESENMPRFGSMDQQCRIVEVHELELTLKMKSYTELISCRTKIWFINVNYFFVLIILLTDYIKCVKYL